LQGTGVHVTTEARSVLRSRRAAGKAPHGGDGASEGGVRSTRAQHAEVSLLFTETREQGP